MIIVERTQRIFLRLISLKCLEVHKILYFGTVEAKVIQRLLRTLKVPPPPFSESYTTYP